jgi:heme/copper-type cytochrome/quinol oxidase subunit 3
MDAPTTIDVSQLPPVGFDAQSPGWWGNVLFMIIETTTIALLLASYFYAWQGSHDWPPPHADAAVATAERWPSPVVATIDLLVLVASCLPMAWVDRAARRHNGPVVRTGLVVVTLAGIATIVLRFYEFPPLRFRWDENTYASLVWTILFMHLTYLIAATLEVVVTAAWVFHYGMSEKMEAEVTLAAAYWYWMALLWLPLYVVVFWAPRML